MKVCKIRPQLSTCRGCTEYADLFGEIPDCSHCIYQTTEYEILQFVSGFLSCTYVLILKDGEVKKVSIDRIYDVKEI